MRRHWWGCRPAAGWMFTVVIFSGVCAATSSMSMPPAAEPIMAIWPFSRLSVSER